MSELRFTLGTEKLTGMPIEMDITKAPHLLVAGMTGSGKSVFMNAMICDLITRYSWHELRLVLIDPKRVELSQFKTTPHAAYIGVTPAETTAILMQMTTMMQNRFRELEEFGCRDLDSYNEQQDPLPRFVVVIDEMANLMLAPKPLSDPIERALCDLAAMGRAVGIHCVMATQRPDATVLTGLIRANVPTRVSFGVVSGLESRIILDEMGAEDLMGPGSGLVRLPGKRDLVRFTGRYVSEDDIEKVVNMTPWTSQPDHTGRIEP